MSQVLSLDEFTNELCQYWGVDWGEVDPSRPLEELGVDSLGMLELIVMLEDFAGHEVPEELWGESATLQDIYDSYQVYASRDRMDPGQFFEN